MGVRNREGTELSYLPDSLCSLAGRNETHIRTRFLAPIDCLKIPALEIQQNRNSDAAFSKIFRTIVKVFSYVEENKDLKFNSATLNLPKMLKDPLR
jgi:hypothetical protein